MKDNKTAKIEMRLTPEEKDKIKEYCEKHHITISEFLRIACQKVFSQEER